MTRKKAKWRLWPLAQLEKDMKTDLGIAARGYHYRHRGIYAQVCAHAEIVFAREKKRGVARVDAKYAIGNLWEAIRWTVYQESDDYEEYKMPNDFRAYYARQYLIDHQDTPQLFELCKLRHATAGKLRRYKKYMEIAALGENWDDWIDPKDMPK